MSRFTEELQTFYNGLSMTGGDMGSLSQLFFDNLSTLLGALFAVQAMENFGVDRSVIDDVVWGRLVPGVGVTLFIGNIYYSWQAIRLTNKHGRQYTAQPYGLNTPAAFSFIFNIMYPVYFSNVGTIGPNDAFMLSYKVALAANFITGIISAVLGGIGPQILRFVPPAGLLVPIAGIGIAFLGLEQLTNSIKAPLVGYSAIMWVFLGWYSGVRVGFGNFRIPEALMVILVGVALGWITGLNTGDQVDAAADNVKWWGPTWTADELFADFSLAGDYIGVIVPLGISAASSTLMCLVSAKEAGDPYPIRETMLTDGIGTMLTSFFGSPFGTVIYIGHPAHKRSGAKVGYSLINGCIYFFFSWIGLLAVIQAIVNSATVGPIVFFVGLQINEECLNFLPSRHYPAYLIGLFPSIYDWVTNISATNPLSDDTFQFNTEYPGDGIVGVYAWKRGALLVSMVWTSMAVMVLDRKWPQAIMWAMLGALLALFGVIHMPEAGFDTFSEPLLEQCSGLDDDGKPTCWEDAQQWMFFVAYLILAATFGLIMIAAKFDDTIQEPVDDESAHAFDDWFKDAAKGAEETSDEEVAKKIDEEEEEAEEPAPKKEIASENSEDEA